MLVIFFVRLLLRLLCFFVRLLLCLYGVSVSCIFVFVVFM